MAGLAAVTEKIKIFASVAVLTIPPAIVARMASTIDSISHGRFGVNIVSGWAQGRVRPDGPVAGREPFRLPLRLLHRIRDGAAASCWETGTSDFKGKYFQMTDCRLSPRPEDADQDRLRRLSPPAGMEFGATYCDYSFALGKGVNTPTAHAPTNDRLMVEAAAKTGRDVGTYMLFMVIADETDEAAMAKWQALQRGRRPWAPWPGCRARPTPIATADDGEHRQAQLAAPEARGQPQHGHARGLLRQRGADAGRGGRGARAPTASCWPSTTSWRAWTSSAQQHPAADEEPQRPARQSRSPEASAIDLLPWSDDDHGKP